LSQSGVKIEHCSRCPQVFIEAEYAPLNDLTDVRLIIDLGANIGLSSVYFLNVFPGASVIAVEPDAANFDLLKRNIKPYGNRAKAIHAGIWSHPARLTINTAPYRDGREWSKQVVECDAVTKDSIDGVDIPTLLKYSGHNEISLLKIDIEGAEAVIFATNYSWLPRVGAIAIELHDD
jgi:FkbM family methyltransferase